MKSEDMKHMKHMKDMSKKPMPMKKGGKSAGPKGAAAKSMMGSRGIRV